MLGLGSRLAGHSLAKRYAACAWMASRGSVGRSKLVSQSALSAILEEIKKNGMPENTSRRSIKRSKDADLDINTPYGPLIVYEDFNLRPKKGEKKSITVQFPFLNPLAYLHHVSANCDGFASFFRDCLATNTPSLLSPYRIIAYADEVTPGNVLRAVNERKVQVCYWAFAEYGVRQLSCERHWFILGIARSEHVKRLPGGMSQWMKMGLLKFYQPYDFRLGIQIRFPSGARNMVFGKLQIYLGDAAALKEILDVKGAAGLLLCPLCQNITQKGSDYGTFDRTGTLLPSTNLDLTKVVLHTDASIRETLDHLASKKGSVSKSAFEAMTTFCGLNFNPDGVLWSDTLNMGPVSGLMWDWCHTYVSPGIWNVELGLLLKALKKIDGVGQDELHDALSELRWPKTWSQSSVTGRTIFGKEQDEDIKCSASEALSVYSAVRFVLVEWKNQGLLERATPQVDSYLALSRVLDLLQAIRNGSTRASTLEESILAHLQLFLNAYGDAKWKPKHHYSTHLGRRLSQFKLLCSCWVHERKHREVKRFANLITNTWSNWEESVLRDATLLHLTELHGNHGEPYVTGLKNPAPTSPGVSMVLNAALGQESLVEVSTCATYSPGAVAYESDVVLVAIDGAKAVGQIEFFARVGGDEYVCVKRWVSCGKNRFDPNGNVVLIPLTSIKDTCIYTQRGDQMAVVPSSLWTS